MDLYKPVGGGARVQLRFPWLPLRLWKGTIPRSVRNHDWATRRYMLHFAGWGRVHAIEIGEWESTVGKGIGLWHSVGGSVLSPDTGKALREEGGRRDIRVQTHGWRLRL